MPDDKASILQQADRLYQSFPDFSAWLAPTEEDLRLWNHFASRLEEIREKATPEALRNSVEVAVRAAAMDTGAIEGLYTVDRSFTMTVATQAFAWEHALEEKGAEVRELFGAQLEAYELVIDAVTRRLPISEAWIRALHEKVCGGQQTYRVLTDQGYQEQRLPKGSYKTQSNHVRLTDGSIHPYSPVDRVPSEMYRLLEQVRASEFENAHPISQASYIHYAFVVIHPFADGNGRVARALASVFFYRAQSIPVLVFANQRMSYLDALHQADLGSLGPLLTFFRERGIDTMQLVVEQLLTSGAPAPDEVFSRITPRYVLPVQEMENAARRLMAAVREQLSSQVPSSFEDYFRLRQEIISSPVTGRAGYRPLRGDEKSLQIVVQDFADRNMATSINVLIALDPSSPFAFLIEEPQSRDDLEVRLEDAYPEISDVLRLRLSNWARRVLGRLLKRWEETGWTAPP